MKKFELVIAGGGLAAARAIMSYREFTTCCRPARGAGVRSYPVLFENDDLQVEI